jgi:hypothetical protein
MSDAGTLFPDDVPAMMRRATISPCNLYRYRLTRRWAAGGRPLTFVMLNPSIADDQVDDPTIRRCIAFAKREGCSSLIVVNLFALRATDPAELLKARDPFGPKNDEALLSAVDGSLIYEAPVVCAWGTKGGAGAARFRKIVSESEAEFRCLGATKDGHPRHPLYVPGRQPLLEFRP